jgi:hypothetical protein
VPSHLKALEDRADAAAGIFIKRIPQIDKREKSSGQPIDRKPKEAAHFIRCPVCGGWFNVLDPGSALAPSGLFAVVKWHQRLREETAALGEPRGPRTELRMSPEQTARPVEAGGLKLVQIVEVPPYHYGAVFKRPVS